MTWIDGCLVINLSRLLCPIAKPEWTPGPVLGHREVARMDIWVIGVGAEGIRIADTFLMDLCAGRLPPRYKFTFLSLLDGNGVCPLQ
jgi:hypothetical protein